MLIEVARKHKYAKIQFLQAPIKEQLNNFYCYEVVTNLDNYSLKKYVIKINNAIISYYNN